MGSTRTCSTCRSTPTSCRCSTCSLRHSASRRAAYSSRSVSPVNVFNEKSSKELTRGWWDRRTRGRQCSRRPQANTSNSTRRQLFFLTQTTVHHVANWSYHQAASSMCASGSISDTIPECNPDVKENPDTTSITFCSIGAGMEGCRNSRCTELRQFACIPVEVHVH